MVGRVEVQDRLRNQSLVDALSLPFASCAARIVGAVCHMRLDVACELVAAQCARDIVVAGEDREPER